ncbi:hypothetical protein B0T16DRAFT_503238 [Cercophora newfieldiana]|uniref:Chitin-binding type-4 domain-containing protein n=1 Tax=Cercophora newfieldiana TaxID=92897 RepID=A0AA39YGI8_9PEZI|nr:hypothetical protein B0T16DRAFT_503238 [Cercophora newfieldiana]
MHPLSLLPFATLALSHGLVTSPLGTRTPGAATAAACGQTLVTFYNADNTSYPEALLRANPSGLRDGYDAAKCNLWLCKGFQFADNAANVKSYKPGDVIDMQVRIRIAHKGYANVSVVDMAANKVIGTPLISWADNYAASTSPPEDQVKFSVKVPELGGKCTKAGECTIQWYWFGQGQTYESCIDFTVPAAAAAAHPGHEHRRSVAGRAMML